MYVNNILFWFLDKMFKCLVEMNKDIEKYDIRCFKYAITIKFQKGYVTIN